MGFFFFKKKTAYEMRISDCSSDVCSSDLGPVSLSLHLVGRHIAPVCHCWFHPAPVRTPGTDGSHQGGGVLFPAAVHHSGSDVRRDAPPGPCRQNARCKHGHIPRLSKQEERLEGKDVVSTVRIRRSQIP